MIQQTVNKHVCPLVFKHLPSSVSSICIFLGPGLTQVQQALCEGKAISYSKKDTHLGVRTSYLPLIFTICVTLENLLNLSPSQFLYLYSLDTVSMHITDTHKYYFEKCQTNANFHSCPYSIQQIVQ